MGVFERQFSAQRGRELVGVDVGGAGLVRLTPPPTQPDADAKDSHGDAEKNERDEIDSVHLNVPFSFLLVLESFLFVTLNTLPARHDIIVTVSRQTNVPECAPPWQR